MATLSTAMTSTNGPAPWASSESTPRRAPNANSIAERVVRSIRVECLDHLIVINDRHLMAVLTNKEAADAKEEEFEHPAG